MGSSLGFPSSYFSGLYFMLYFFVDLCLYINFSLFTSLFFYLPSKKTMKVSWVRGECVNLLSDAFGMKTICKNLKCDLYTEREWRIAKASHERDVGVFSSVSPVWFMWSKQIFSPSIQKQWSWYQMCFPDSLKIYIIQKVSRVTLLLNCSKLIHGA